MKLSLLIAIMSFPDDSLVETLHANAGASEDVGSIPGSRRILEKEMATLFSILAWKIPGTKDPGGLRSMGSERVRHDWAYSHMCAIMLFSFHHVLGFLVWFILLFISLLFLFFYFFFWFLKSQFYFSHLSEIPIFSWKICFFIILKQRICMFLHQGIGWDVFTFYKLLNCIVC